MSEIPRGYRPPDTREELSLAALISSATIPFLKAGEVLIQSHPVLSSGEKSRRLLNATAENMNLPIAAMLMLISYASDHKDSRSWTRLALAEGLIGAAGEVLLSAGSSALGSPEMTAAGVILKGGSYVAEIGQCAIMHWRLNMYPRRSRNNHSFPSPLPNA